MSLAVGDPGTVDRFGGTLTLLTGVKALRQGGLPLFSTATDLWLSIEGGFYDGTGAASATVYALALT